MSTQLEPIEPAEAVEWYLSERTPELSKKTILNQRYRLNSFVEWCDEYELENMNDLTGRHLHRFRRWRQDEGGINKVTLQGQLQTFRVFLEFCANIDAVESGLREKVLMPTVSAEDEARNVFIDSEHARKILDYLEKFHYASRDHVIFAILWHAGIRLGSLRAIDLRDVDLDARCIDLVHRPGTDTPLKNKEAAERSVAVGEHYCEVLSDYIEHNREDTRDDYNRRPLITSAWGRLGGASIRETVYSLTRPCTLGPCPHDRDVDSCEAMEHQSASKCPSSHSPHAIRRGSITQHLRDGTPGEIVTERMNVSAAILDQHYDERTEREKMEIRRSFLEGT